MIKVAPSILAADFANLGAEVSKLKSCGADLVHIDIMDGHFVPNLSIGPAVVKSLRPYTDLPFDVHLMISEPEKYIETFANSGADLITTHIETLDNVNHTIGLIKTLGKKAGLSLKPSTPICEIEKYIGIIDLVLVMSVNPGFGGQKFMEESLGKIKALKQIILENDFNTLIEVDGGIGLENAKQITDAGADILVTGTSVFRSDDISKTIAEIKAV